MKSVVVSAVRPGSRAGVLIWALLLLAVPTVCPAQDEPAVKEGWVVIQQEILFGFLEEPADTLSRARDEFETGTPSSAAMELRRAVYFLEMKSARATDAGKKRLRKAIGELNGWADRFEQGEQGSAEELQSSIGRIHLSVARHHAFKLAEEEGYETNPLIAANDLKGALFHLQQAAARAGVTLSPEDVDSIEMLQALREKLEGNSPWSPEERKTALGTLDHLIEDLQTRTSPGPKASDHRD
jgi:hypothetical protein